MAILYVPGETPKEVQPLNGKKFTLEEMQKLVGGYVETRPLGGGLYLAMDEDGLYKRPIYPNIVATEIIKGCRPDLMVKTLVGPVVKYKRGEF